MKTFFRYANVILTVFVIFSVIGTANAADVTVPAVPDVTVPAVPDVTVVLPDPTVTVVPDPTVTTVPDPTVTVVPDPTVTTVPDPTVTTVPDPTVTTVPDPTVTVVPDPTVTVVPDPTATTTPQPETNETPVPTPTTNGTPVPTPTTNETPIPAPASSSGGSSSGTNYVSNDKFYSGGSQSVATSNVDPFSNIVKYETRDHGLIAGKSSTYEFSTPEFSIYEVSINAKENDIETSMRIEHLKNKSMYAKSAPPGLVYANENVWIENNRLNYMTVKFRVDKSWIGENDIVNKYVVSLLRWNGTAWLAYKVNMKSSDDSYVYFESWNMSVPTLRSSKASLSLFAISAFPKRPETSLSQQVPVVPKEEEEIVGPEEYVVYAEDAQPGEGTYDIIQMIKNIIRTIENAISRGA